MTSKPTLLIVDDEQDIRFMLAQYFREKGFNILEADNAATGLEAFRSEKVNVIISDIRMAGGNGDELLQAIRETTTKVPFILITGFSDFSLEQALSMGAEALLSKPFSLAELHEVVSRSMEPIESKLSSKAPPVKITLEANLHHKGSNEGRVNIARGGMFISLDGELPRELDFVRFKFSFSDQNVPPLEGTGRVRWVRRSASPGLPRGIGVEFVSIPEGPRSRLLNMIDVSETSAFIPNSLANLKKTG